MFGKLRDTKASCSQIVVSVFLFLFAGWFWFSWGDPFGPPAAVASEKLPTVPKIPRPPLILAFNGEARQDRSASLRLKNLHPTSTYSLSFSVDSPSQLDDEGQLTVILSDQSREILNKSLHLGDPDVYLLFRPSVAGDGRIEMKLSGPRVVRYRAQVLEWKGSVGGKAVTRSGYAKALLETEPNDQWSEANSIELGRTVFGTADDHHYIPLQGTTNRIIEGHDDWFRFDFTGDRPKLVYFELDLTERDNIPVDVSLYTVSQDQLKPYDEGADPVTPPHEVQALSGNKFTTRVFKEKGTYYVRVRANHPLYQLRTTVYEVPPYTQPSDAVRAAVDFILGAGDSWHANTPRKGGVYDRVANVHQETSLCVACHPTHFSQRAQLYAVKNGYPVKLRPQLQFLAERFYNNPRPFYGHPQASWNRVISAPANVLSRMAALLNLYEGEVTGEHRPKMFEGVSEYLKLYYKDRTTLPPDETNGNTPLVSAYEVAWYSWVVLDAQFRRTGDPSDGEMRDRIRKLIEQSRHKNMVDLCYQTLALSAIDQKAFAAKIRENAEKVLSHQRPSGQWAMTFDKGAPEAEFQTGHCLWTLAVAGYPSSDPRIAKALDYLLKRQQMFGGWFDPLQSYENFRTPFRETQMAVLALSEFYKGPEFGKDGALRGDGRRMGWQRGFLPLPQRLSLSEPELLINELDNIWENLSPAVLADVIAAVQSEEALIRQAAAAALGRTADPRSVDALRQALGDSNKMVQRTAAWSLRQLGSRKSLGIEAMQSALGDSNERVRLGATRIFWTHFSYLTHHKQLADSLIQRLADASPTIRLNALKGLWQWWYWNDDVQLRGKIEDAFLGGLAQSQHPWVARNLREGIYNIADDNIRYLYNNWIPLLAKDEDRDKAVLGRLAVERQLADKIADVLRGPVDRQKLALLEALGQFHLRHPDSYSANEKLVSKTQALYVRIGNDVEQSAFFGRSVETLGGALLPLLSSSDPAMRRAATLASYVLREVKPATSYGARKGYDFHDVLRLAEADRYEPARQEVGLEVLKNLNDPTAGVRGVAYEIYKSFPVAAEGSDSARAASVLLSLLLSPFSEAQLGALDVMGRSGNSFETHSQLTEAVKSLLLKPEPSLKPRALTAIKGFTTLQKDPAVLSELKSTLASKNPLILRSALELILQAPVLEKNSEIFGSLDAAFRSKDTKTQKVFFEVLNADPALRKSARGISWISEALQDDDLAIVQSALSLLIKDEELQKQPAIVAALDETRKNQALAAADREVAEAIYQGKKLGELELASAPTRQLDYSFFVDRVQPILESRGKDGNACVYCHSIHTIFKLIPPTETAGPPKPNCVRITAMH